MLFTIGLITILLFGAGALLAAFHIVGVLLSRWREAGEEEAPPSLGRVDLKLEELASLEQNSGEWLDAVRKREEPTRPTPTRLSASNQGRAAR